MCNVFKFLSLISIKKKKKKKVQDKVIFKVSNISAADIDGNHPPVSTVFETLFKKTPFSEKKCL